MNIRLFTQAAAGTNTVLRFFPRDAEPPPTNFGTLDSRNSHPIIDFDPTTAETMCFRDYIPDKTTFHPSSTALTFNADFLATSAITGVLGVSISLERIAPGGIDLDSDNFGTAKSASVTVDGTSGKVARVSVGFLLSELPAGLAVGDMLRVRLTRNTAVGSNHAGDAEFVGMFANITPAT